MRYILILLRWPFFNHNTCWYMPQRYICKNKFLVCYRFFRYENPRRKNFISSCPKHRKIINRSKNNLFSRFFVVPQKDFIFWGTEKGCENKKIYIIFPLIPLRRQGLILRFIELPTYTISVSLTIEIHKNNIDTSWVTNKQYYKIILF